MARPPQDSNRKEKLIEIALKILVQKGYSQLSFQKVANSARISQSTVMHYFPSKDSLLSEISSYVAKKNREYVESSEKLTDDAETRLRNFLIKNFQWAEKHPEYAQIIVLLSFLSIANDEFKSLYNTRLTSVREKILGILYAGQREKLFFFNKGEAEALSAMIHNFIVAAVTNFLASSDTKEKRDFPQKVEILIHKLVKNPLTKTNAQ